MNAICRQMLAAALCAAMCPLAAYAQSSTGARARYVTAQASLSDASAPGVPADDSVQAPTVECDAAANTCCCNSCCDCCGGCGILSCWPCGCLLSDLGEACKLWEPCCEDSQWAGAGWLAQSFVWNPYNPTDRFNGPMTWNDRSNDYQMNELFYYFGRAAKTDGCGFDWGFRTDAMYGTSYRWNTSAGFETNWGSNGSFYGIAMPQLYGEVAYNDLTVKVGRWYSPVGYYVIGTANNFFPILPYTFQYGEPFTHTGVFNSYKYSDKLTLGAGVTHGWDSSDNSGNPYAGYIATATYTIVDKRALAYVGVAGMEPNASGVNPTAHTNVFGGHTGYTPRYLQTLVYTNKLSDDVLWVLQSDYGRQDDAVTAGRTAMWYGLNTYLYWNMTCRCQWGLNMEWFRDDGGFRVGQVLPSFGSPNARGFARGVAGPAAPGFNGSFYRAMFGPKYYFTPNIYGRVAAVADWYGGKRDTTTNNLPYDDGTKASQQVMAFDLIATF